MDLKQSLPIRQRFFNQPQHDVNPWMVRNHFATESRDGCGNPPSETLVQNGRTACPSTLRQA
jgi:hypothetical protein